MRPVPYRRDGCGPRARRWRTPSCSDTMERLMRLVVAQGETIQNQLRRLNQRENQIETYEQQMHLLRVQSLGNDYLLSSYLHDQQTQPQEYPAAPVQVNSNSQSYLATADTERRCQTQQRREQMLPVSRSQVEDMENNMQQSNAQYNQALMPGLPVPHEVYAKPINLQGNHNDLHVQGAERSNNASEERERATKNIRENFGRNCTRFSDRFTRFTNRDETISEEKSNDSGVVIGDDSLGTSVEERTHSEIEDFGEEEVQERILLLSKMDELLTRLLHEEEVIQGLSSTVEIIQTQQKQETSELEGDLKRAAEEHSVLVAEVRSNEQQIRVLDTSASQKKKLIDALLKDEMDSDHETRYLQAQLDYILHLPPTAFRLPEEGDDPPPLPPPPVHPACLVQSLLHHQPPQLVHPTPAPSSNFLTRNETGLTMRHNSPNRNQPSGNVSYQHRHATQLNSISAPPISSFVNRPPSPNILLAVNRAPSPTILSSNRAPSPTVRYANRSCSPNKRKPLQPPPYNHIKHTSNVNLSNIGLKDQLESINNSTKINNNESKVATKTNEHSSSNGNALKKLISHSLPTLPNRTNPIISFSKNGANDVDEKQSDLVSNNLLKAKERLHNSSVTKPQSSTVNTEDSCDDVPPPLPLCPPPSLTPPVNNAINIINDNINNNISKLSSIISSSNENTTKRNILNSLGTKMQLNKPVSYRTSAANSVEDDESTHTTSSVSSRSSTSSETSMSNCSSTASSATANDNYLQSTTKVNSNVIQRINNPITIPKDNKSCQILSNNCRKIKVLNDNVNSVKDPSPCYDNIDNNITNTSNKKDPDSGDSNSDTGLSSLHSSSDEGGYALDTLV